MKTGEMIRKARLKKKMRVFELAKKVDVIAAYITQIEQYNKLPSLKVLKKIMDCLDLDVDLLTQYLKEKEGPKLAKYITETISTLPLRKYKSINIPKKKEK